MANTKAVFVVTRLQTIARVVQFARTISMKLHRAHLGRIGCARTRLSVNRMNITFPMAQPQLTQNVNCVLNVQESILCQGAAPFIRMHFVRPALYVQQESIKTCEILDHA